MSKRFLILSVLLLLLLAGIPIGAAAITIDFKEQYQDYQGNTYKLTQNNLLLHPYYLESEDATNRYFLSMGTTITIPKTQDVILSDTRISPSMTFPKTLLASKMVNYNATIGYLVFPYSLNRIKDWSDDHNIKAGRWLFDTGITISDSNGTIFDPQFYDFKIVNDEIRLYFNKSEANKLTGNITFQMNSWSITNATTSGFTSANVSLDNGNATWQGDYGGSLAINLRNDSALNMSGLVLSYGMGENGTLVVHNTNNFDGSVNSTNQGTYYGETSIPTMAGVIGNATVFDGIDDYIVAGKDNSLNVTDVITISIWIKRLGNGTNDNNRIISKGSDGYNIFISNSSRLLSFYVTTSAGSNQLVSTIPILDNIWYNIVVTYNKNLLTNNMNLFINGNLNNNKNFTSLINITTTNLRIGDSAIGSRNFNGSIDEVRIWNRALSASEIATAYNTSLRTQAMPVFSNQTAAPGNVISNISINYFAGNSSNNISIYGRQNGTTPWNIIQANALNNTVYDIPSGQQFSSMDFGVLMQGSGNNTIFLTSVNLNESLAPVSIIGHVNNTLGTSVDGVRVDLGGYHTYTRTTRVVNNTDLAPALGTGTRVQGTTYTASNDVVIWIFCQTTGTAGDLDIDFYIDGVKVQDDDTYINAATPGNRSKWFNVPKDATYMVDISATNLDHYEWREYPIYSGYYSFQNVPVGNYTLLFQQVGYNNNSQPLNLMGDVVVNATLIPTDSSNTLNIAEFALILALTTFALIILYRKRKNQPII